MNKKFVLLSSDHSPSQNPYEIRTYENISLRQSKPEWYAKPCSFQHNCNQNSTLDKVLTLQDEIRHIHQRTQENIFLKAFHKKCKKEYRFTTCVVPQRTPEQLRLHSITCENILKVQSDIKEQVDNVGNSFSKHESFINLKDPVGGFENEKNTVLNNDELVIPELASPECSREIIFVPPKKLLGLKRPKSGVYVNETERPEFTLRDDFSYSTYNPRELQKQFDAQNIKNIDLIPCKDNGYMWTWNVGLQKKESELDQMFIEAATPKFNCKSLDVVVYNIPKDLGKTFSAYIIFGTKAVHPQPLPRKKPRFHRPIEMACLYVAFIEGFRLNADFWTSITLDNIIKMAEKLIETCIQLNYKSQSNEFDIISQIHARQAAFDIKLHYAGIMRNEPNIYKVLSVYFSKYSTCILCSNNLYLLIWKRCKNVFYVYDPNGRTENCTRDFENGKSALLYTHFVEHLVHFIVNISHTSLDDEFKLYEIFLTSFGKIPNPLPNKPFPKTHHKKWAVVNESYAVIPGCNNGIFQPTTQDVNNPSMLISVMAILYAHIEGGDTWKPDQVDELIRLGTAYYKSLRRILKLKDSEPVTILDLPDKYVLGTFKASLKKVSFMFTGTVTDLCKKYTDSLLYFGMQEFFDNNGEAALLQVDSSVLGIWRDSNLYYVYDPFRRGRAGQVLDPEDYRAQGTAILQLHANIDSLLKTLYESSIKMRRGAKFFIHSINVGCIKPIMDGKPRKLRYPKLKLTPETYEQSIDHEGEYDISASPIEQKKEKRNKKNKKSKKHKEKLVKVCSIETLDENDRIVVIKSTEIVEPLAEDIICEIIAKFPDAFVNRPKLYKSADRVLLHSDKEYLEYLKYMLQHDEDYDNMEMNAVVEEDEKNPIISVEEELKLPSNFKSLPDGSWIIFGLQRNYREDEAQFKLTGLLSSIVTAALTTKYKISTWTPQLVDHALESVNSFGDAFLTYQYALGALLHKKIPKLKLGDKTYQINVKKVIRSDGQKSLRHNLIEALINFNRLMVICQSFCCLIVKRLNFLYMFCGFPVNHVGFRKHSTGPGCMLRFLELDPLIRRIEFGCNSLSCDVSNYAVVLLKVWDITSEAEGRYRSLPQNMEQQMYNEAFDENKLVKGSKTSKAHFLNKELAKEKRRIKNFETTRLTRSKTKQGQSSGGMSLDEIRIENEDEEELSPEEAEEIEEECSIEAKHNFDSENETFQDEDIHKPRPLVVGYRLREKDLLFKIQGSRSLDGRTNCVDDKIKPCLFASALAILYSILKPLSKWTSYRIDQVIDSTLLLKERIEDMSNTPERVLENISVDDYIFNILLKDHSPLGLNGIDLEKQLERIFSQKKYLILLTANCSYAIIRDEYYHLFDPYPSMALMENEDEQAKKNDSEALKRLRSLTNSIRLYGERNTASWILFADINSMIEYLNQRACNKTWKERQEYMFSVLEIISFKKAPQSKFILQMLTEMQTCNRADDQELAICTQNETIAWLQHRLPIWSRLNRKNASGLYREVAVTKIKNYDIEIDQCLWSLWGNLHPQAPVFEISTRGKQYLACCVICLCAASTYRLIDWSPHLLDSIIISGDRYLKQSLKTIKCNDYELALEDLDAECQLDIMEFFVHIEMVAYGKLYSRPDHNRMNLAEALMYFFNYFQFGILQCFKQSLAIGFVPGNEGGYFMFDCQSRDKPLFSNGQGCSYILRTKYLQVLLYCIVITLNIPYYNMHFTLHKVIPRVKNQNRNSEYQTLGKVSEKSSQKSSNL